MSEPIPEGLIHIDDEVLRILGVTPEQIASMGLREFAELSFDRGVVWQVSSRKAGKGKGGLAIVVDAAIHNPHR